MALTTVAAYPGALLTQETGAALLAARRAGCTRWTGSLDLARSQGTATLSTEHWSWHDATLPYPGKLRDRTIYQYDGDDWAPLSRFNDSLIKLVPTEWGPPTFEIDGVKMLVSAKISPIDDARRKVALIEPRGKTVLDTCGGLGYFAACCLAGGVTRLQSFEKNADVLWLRTMNPWSPDPDAPENASRLQLVHGDVAQTIRSLPDASVDAVLHDPPRFGIAGELYSGDFYAQIARVLRSGGRLFHYTGSPNELTSGRNVPREVSRRLETAGFSTQLVLDGVLAVKR